MFVFSSTASLLFETESLSAPGTQQSAIPAGNALGSPPPSPQHPDCRHAQSLLGES